MLARHFDGLVQAGAVQNVEPANLPGHPREGHRAGTGSATLAGAGGSEAAGLIISTFAAGVPPQFPAGTGVHEGLQPAVRRRAEHDRQRLDVVGVLSHQSPGLAPIRLGTQLVISIATAVTTR